MSRISTKNQITIPARVLRASGLQPGDDVRVSVEAPGLLRVERAEEVVDRFAGIFDASVYPPGYREELRREWE